MTINHFRTSNKKQTRSVWKTCQNVKKLSSSKLMSSYKLIGIDLTRQTNANIPQQMNFTVKLANDNGTTIFLITEKHHKLF